MSFDWKALLANPWPEKTYSYTQRDTLLYAQSEGFGADPMNAEELPFVFEGGGLKVAPTQATVVAWDESPILDTGINRLMAVHGSQKVTIHKPLPAAANISASIRFPHIYDKGEGKGAIIIIETEIRDLDSKDLLCTNQMTVIARGDGGFGGPSGSPPAPHALPARAPDSVVDYATSPGAAFLYALNGDYNPLHRDPAFAKKAGFPRPVLQGLCTYGIGCKAILSSQLSFDPTAIREIGGRFSAPMYPGETARTEIWRDDKNISFRCSLPERDNIVIFNNGLVVLH